MQAACPMGRGERKSDMAGSETHDLTLGWYYGDSDDGMVATCMKGTCAGSERNGLEISTEYWDHQGQRIGYFVKSWRSGWCTGGRS